MPRLQYENKQTPTMEGDTEAGQAIENDSEEQLNNRQYSEDIQKA
jgi:hypothetical protein